MRLRLGPLAACVLLVIGTAACDAPSATPVAPVERQTTLTTLPTFGGGYEVVLQGWDAVRAGTPCIWNAFASGGTAPYTYEWTFTGGDGTGYDGTFLGQPDGGPFRLEVTVTDANGAVVSDAIDGSSSLSDPQCPILY